MGQTCTVSAPDSAYPLNAYDWDYWSLKYAWRDEMVWQIETVDDAGDVGGYPSLALDGSSRPRVSYFDYARSDLIYAQHDGMAWQLETVDSGGYVGMYTSLALDESDRPHVSYYDNGNGDLKYARYDGAAWRVETVDSEGWVGAYTSLALDESGRPHVSYYAYAPHRDLKYAWHDGADWQIETVDSEGWVGDFTSLALDGAGWPHISYYDSTNGNLKYARRDGTGWYIETVDGVDNVGTYTSLELDGSGRPHISYYDITNDDLKYAWRDGAVWHIETVAHVSIRSLRGGGGSGSATLLALDSSGRPRISYLDGAHLKYAWRDGTTWRIETVDNVESMDIGASLVLDGSDRPHICYYDYIEGDLRYAQLMHPLLLDKQATPKDGLHNDDTLTYTLTISGSGQTVRLWDPLAASVYYITDSITSTLTPAAVYSPSVGAVLWEGTLPTDTVQEVRFRVTPGISGTEPLSLSQSIVNTAWLTVTAGTESGRSVSATVIVNGWRVYLPVVLRHSP